MATEALQSVHTMFGPGTSSLQIVALLKSDEDHMVALTGQHEMSFHQTESSQAVQDVFLVQIKKRANRVLISQLNVAL